MSKIAMFFRYAPIYREKIYLEIDRKLDVEWFFGDSPFTHHVMKIKPMDYSKLKTCEVCFKEHRLFGNWIYLSGLNNINLKKYALVVSNGNPNDLTTWLLLLKSIFNNKTKIALWTHGYYCREGLMKKMVKKIYYGLADYVLLYGNYAKNGMMADNIVKNEEKLRVIYNSLDYSAQLAQRNKCLSECTSILQSHFDNFNKNLIFIGRLTKVKKLNLILELVARLKIELPLNVTFIGNGSEYESLKALAVQLGIEENVWFYGECYDDSLTSSLIYSADLCISPGNVGLTAMHCLMFGCPVATHNDFTMQMPEFEAIQPDLTGFFFKPDNIESITEETKRWFATHNDRESTRQECFKIMDTKYNPTYQISVIEQVVNEIWMDYI